MEENNGIGGVVSVVVSDEHILTLVHRYESYSELFWGATSRGNSSEDKIYRCTYAICESVHTVLRFSPYFSSQDNRQDVWQTKKQRQNQKAPDEHLRLDM